MLPTVRSRIAVLVFALVLPAALIAAVAVAQRGPGGRMPRMRNLKILKPEQVMSAMRGFTGALGVRCDFCHVEGAFDKDDKPTKRTARGMLMMVNDLNAKYKVVGRKVTCVMCHRGRSEPQTRGAGDPGDVRGPQRAR